MKLNQSSKPKITMNHEQRTAYVMPPKYELAQRVSTWFVNEPKFYTNDSENEEIITLIRDISKEDPEFILKIALYSREKLFLRTAPVFLLVEASLIDKCKPFVRKYVPQILTRADQLAEAVAYLQSRIGHIGSMQDKGSMPAGLKKGIADTILQFKEHALSKYNRDSEVKLKDVIKLVHPKPKDTAQSDLFKRAMEGKLTPAETWETIISNKGSTTENWQYASTKMGYMALLRNFRNLMEHDCDLTKALSRISDNEQVQRSRQYPFRFLSAYMQIQGIAHPQSSAVLQSISHALEVSIMNVPEISGSTYVAVDQSPSMNDSLSRHSTVMRWQVANMFAAIINKRWGNVIIDIFSNEHKIVNLPRTGLIVQSAEQLQGQVRSWGTDIGLPLHDLTNKKVKVDRIIYLTDEEGNGQYDLQPELNRYRKEVNPNAKAYIMNLAGYGTTGVPEGDTLTSHFSGFSEKILDYIHLFESGHEGQVTEIENYATSKPSSG